MAIDGILPGIVCNIIRTKGFGPVALFGFVEHPMDSIIGLHFANPLTETR